MPIEFSYGSEPPPPPSPERSRLARSLFRMGLIVLPLLFVLLLKSLVFDTALVTSASMEPTLAKGDYLLTDHRRVLRGSWGRGDIVIFRSPPSWDSAGEILVKRIVGLPGETISYPRGRLLVNGRAPVEPFIKQDVPDPRAQFPAALTLGPGQYWVLGDNRENSDDSSENGPISESDIQARAVSRLLPWGKFGGVK